MPLINCPSQVFVSAIEKATTLVWEDNEKLRDALTACGCIKAEPAPAVTEA